MIDTYCSCMSCCNTSCVLLGMEHHSVVAHCFTRDSRWKRQKCEHIYPLLVSDLFGRDCVWTWFVINPQSDYTSEYTCQCERCYYLNVCISLLFLPGLWMNNWSLICVVLNRGERWFGPTAAVVSKKIAAVGPWLWILLHLPYFVKHKD